MSESTSERPLSQREEAFLVLYLSGPDSVRGNGTRCYAEAYWGETELKVNGPRYSTAASSAVRLLLRPIIRRRVRELREEAADRGRAKTRDWWELVPDAQETLRRAARGELRGTADDEKVESEQIRQMVRAAEAILDRAMGTPKQMHDVQLTGQAIHVHIAAPGQDLEDSGKPEEARLSEGVVVGRLPRPSGG